MIRVARHFFRFALFCLFAIYGSLALAQKSVSIAKLTLSSNLITKNNTASFVAVVGGASPTGSVVFYDNEGIKLGEAALVNGVATFTKVYTSTQSYRAVSAMYMGDSQNETSLSASQPFIVADAIGPAIQITPGQVAPGQSYTLSIAGLGSYSRADFFDQWNIYQGTIYSGAQLSVHKAGVASGPQMISASYSGSVGSTVSPWSRLVVNAAPDRLTNSEVSIYSETNPLPYNGYVRLKVQVFGDSPTGTVKIINGVYAVATVPLVNGVATYTAYNTGGYGGNFDVEYSGDEKNTPSSGKSAFYKTLPGIKLEASPLQVDVGGNVTLTASLNGYNVTGEVQFMDGTVLLKSMNLTRVTSNLATASFTTTFSKSSTRKLHVNYIGSYHFSPASSPVIQVVVGTGKAESTLSLTANPSSIYVDQDVWLNASILGDNPTGSIKFFDGANQIGVAPINSTLASLSVKLNSVGVHNLTATYPGDSNNAASNSSILSFPVKDKISSNTNLTVSPSSVYVGQSIILNATVTGSSPGGTVSFLDGTTTLATKTLVNGATSFSTSSLTQGNHTLSATYGGDATNFPSSSSNVTAQVRAKINSTVTVTSSPNPALVGQNVTLKAVVLGSSPAGNVTFSAGSGTLGAAPVIGGVATLVTTGGSYLNVGENFIGAVYSGDVANNWSIGSTNLVLKDGSSILENYIVNSADINEDGCPDYLVKTKDGAVSPIFLLLSGQNCAYALSQPVSVAQAQAAWQAAPYTILVGDTAGDSNGSLLLLPQSGASSTVFNIRRSADRKSFSLLQEFKADKLFRDAASVTVAFGDADGDSRTDLMISVASGLIDIYGAMPNGALSFNVSENRIAAAKLTWKNFLAQTNAGSVDGALNYVDESIHTYVKAAMTAPGANLPAFAGNIKQFLVLADDVPDQVRAAVIFDTAAGGEEMFVIGFGKTKDGVWRIVAM